jgi:hypothetical protein
MSNVLAPVAEHFGDFRREEVLEVVPDGFADAAELFVRLVVPGNDSRNARGRRRGAVHGEQIREVFTSFPQADSRFRQQLECAEQIVTGGASSRRAVPAHGRCAFAPGS